MIIKYGIYANIFAEKNLIWVALAKATHIFFSKNTCEFGIVLPRSVHILTTNELVKLTTLWTTGPRFSCRRTKIRRKAKTTKRHIWHNRHTWKEETYISRKATKDVVCVCVGGGEAQTQQSQGPVVQSIVSLTNSLVIKILTVLVSALSNSQVFLLKMWVAFANAKATHIFFSKNISVYAIFNDQSFNDTLTNDIVSFEQLGPERLTDGCSWRGQSFASS